MVKGVGFSLVVWGSVQAVGDGRLVKVKNQTSNIKRDESK